MKIKTLGIGVFCFCMTLITQAQENTVVTNDLEQWTRLGIAKKLGDKWQIDLNQELRFKHNASQLDIYFFDLGLNYDINKKFMIGLNYRFYQNRNKSNYFETKHRWSTEFKYKHKLDRFALKYRLRFQNKSDDFEDYEEASSHDVKLRNRLSLSYNIKKCKIDPYVQVETFTLIDNEKSTAFDKLRWTMGVKYSLKRLGDIKMFYRIDQQLQADYRTCRYILGVAYKIKL